MEDHLSSAIADYNSKFSQRFGAITSVEFQKYTAPEEIQQKTKDLIAFFTMPEQNLVMFYTGSGHPTLHPALTLMRTAAPEGSPHSLLCYRTEKGETDVFELGRTKNLSPGSLH